MLPVAGELPVSKKNEQKYLTVCSQFKKENCQTVWSPIFSFSNNQQNTSNSSSSSTISPFDEFNYIAEISEEDGLPAERAAGTSDESWSRCSDGLDAGMADPQDNNETAVLANCVSQEKLSEIKDALTKENTSIDVSILRNIPADLVGNFFEEVNISQATIPAVRNFLDCVMNIDPPISLTIATAVIHHVLYPRAMKNDAYRNLINMTLNFSNKYSTSVVEGLLIPFLQSEEFGSFQVEMFTSVFKSMKLQETDYRKIREKIHVVVPSASMFILLSFLIGVQNFMDDHSFDILIKKMKEWSVPYNSDLKYSSLLMKVITAFGKKVNDEQLFMLEEIVVNNNSSFKKLALRELNKLRK